MIRFVVLLFLVVPAVAHAQIVNVQGALAKPPQEDGLAGQLELKLDWRTGNNELFDAGAAGTLLVRHGRLLGLAIARGEYGRGSDTTFKKKTFEHARLRYRIDCRWKWEAYTQHELDAFRRLTVRALVGTGPALQIVDSAPVSVLTGLAYMYEYERFDDRMDTSDAGARWYAHRASFYVTATQKIGEAAALAQTIYVQPRIDEPGDFRMFGEVSITSKLSKHIALTDALVVSYDRTPPEGIKRYDTQLRLALLITFQ